jgi:hypothetical protein
MPTGPRSRPATSEVVLALAVAGFSLAGMASAVPHGRSADLLSVALIVVGSAALVARRRVPVVVLLVATACAVVYQALGHVYARDLPNGTPRRLTRQNDHFEFQPSFSRDGRNVVYTTWNDRELGSVRVVSARGGTGRTITNEPGHYFDPVFSPDGRMVVYRKAGGNMLLSPNWGLNPGLYAVPAAGGEPRFLTESAFQPQFGAENDRVYYLRFDGGSRLLSSIALTGAERGPEPPARVTPERILAERYARGEIDESEYNRRRGPVDAGR